MSTNPEDEIVTLLSQWLARHVDDEELRRALSGADTTSLGAGGREAVAELRTALEKRTGLGELEVAVRETLEALALGPSRPGP